MKTVMTGLMGKNRESERKLEKGVHIFALSCIMMS